MARKKQGLLTRFLNMLKRYFISGLLVWIPIAATVFVLSFVLHLLDSSLLLLPKRYQPEHLFGYHIPGMGVILTIAVILITGVLAANFVGRQLVRFGDWLINHIPLVRSIYSAIKQVMDTVFASNGKSFRKVILVEYPRKGLWSIAFQTGSGSAEIQQHLDGEDVVTLFIPTTPNPTSGFLMYAKRSEVIELQMPVDQALKFVISLGVVQPHSNPTIQQQS